MTDTTDLIQRLRLMSPDLIGGEAADALEQQAAQIKALRADAECLRALLSDVRSALDYHQEQTRPIHSTRTVLDAIDAALRKG